MATGTTKSAPESRSLDIGQVISRQALSLADASGAGLLSQFRDLGFQLHDVDESAGRLLPAQPGELLARYTVANRQFTNLLL